MVSNNLWWWWCLEKSNNILPADKDMNIHMATIMIRAIFAQDGKYYPELFLDDGLYKL